MKNAVWFSRHNPTAAQIDDAQSLGFTITEVTAGVEAGSRSLEDNPGVWGVIDYCRGKDVFGVFPAPVRAMWRTAPAQGPASAWEAWNVSRTPEGGKPTFAHKCWVRVF